MASIHPTAVIDETAVLGDGVEVGAHAVIEGDVTIGDGCIIRPHAVIRRYTTLGRENYVDSFAALGGDPQDYKFNRSQESYLRIGDRNIFREGVTISRATGQGAATVVGSGTMWMANSHAGHNAVVGDNVILPNGSLLAGHTEVADGAILSAGGMVHQFCWIGEKAFFQGMAAVSMHVPPYCLVAARNCVVSLNRVGLQRDERFSEEDRRQIKEAFRLTYRDASSPAKALVKMDACTDWGDAASRWREFVRRVIQAEPPYKRGLCTKMARSRG